MHLPRIPDGTCISVKVSPQAKKTECRGLLLDGTIKIRLKAVPENGEANKELLRFFELETGEKWTIVRGWTHTRKVIAPILKK